MIKQISWEEIRPIWSNYLWANRVSPIETNSAMNYLSGYDGYNMKTDVTFLGYFYQDKLVGVNSGHMCSNNQYRSRGLYVFAEYRNMGVGVELLNATITQARLEQADMIWSFPRKTSWNTYKKAGFILSSDWETSETSDSNAYCYIDLV